MALENNLSISRQIRKCSTVKTNANLSFLDVGLEGRKLPKKGGTTIRRPFTDIVYVSKRIFF